MQTRPTGYKSVSWEAAAHVALTHQSWWEAACPLSGGDGYNVPSVQMTGQAAPASAGGGLQPIRLHAQTK